MNLINLIKFGAAAVALLFAYWVGVQDGHDSEELKNARSEIIQLRGKLADAQTKHKSDALALADLRVAESRSRDEYEWMRQQLSLLESRAAKNNAAGECLRFQRLAVEKEQLLNEAQRGLEFCYKNHR